MKQAKNKKIAAALSVSLLCTGMLPTVAMAEDKADAPKVAISAPQTLDGAVDFKYAPSIKAFLLDAMKDRSKRAGITFVMQRQPEWPSDKAIITAKDLETVKSLKLKVQPSDTDFSWLKYCTNLESLEMEGPALKDFSVLADVQGLKVISLTNGHVQSLEGLEKLKSLESLDLSGNEIKDVQNIIKMPALEKANFSNNQIRHFLKHDKAKIYYGKQTATLAPVNGENRYENAIFTDQDGHEYSIATAMNDVDWGRVHNDLLLQGKDGSFSLKHPESDGLVHVAGIWDVTLLRPTVVKEKPSSNEKGFSLDVKENVITPKENAVKNTKGVLRGFPDGNFHPDAALTRAELAGLLDRMGALSDEGVDHVYSDVYGHWAYNTIYKASHKNIMAGYPDGTFKPDRPLTRAEFFSVIARIQKAEVKERPTMMPWKDVMSHHWAAGSLKGAYDAGFAKGYKDGTFRPDQPVTRAEAASVIARIARVENTKAKDHKTFPDVGEGHWAKNAIEALA